MHFISYYRLKDELSRWLVHNTHLIIPPMIYMDSHLSVQGIVDMYI